MKIALFWELRPVVWYINTNFSEESSASLFRVEK
jgi:hypothetical protein